MSVTTLPFLDVTSEADLATLIIRTVGLPFDVFHVAMLLEMNGVRDSDAQSTFFHEDVFALAETVYQLCLDQAQPPVETPPDYRLGRWATFTSYWRQLAYQLPLLVQVATLLGLGYSLIYYAGFSISETSNIVLAALLSLIATGGMLANPGAIRRRWWGVFLLIGFYTLLALAGYWLNSLTHYIHPIDAEIIAVYFVLLAGYWLSIGLFYALQAYWLPLLVTLVGMAVTIGIKEGTGMGIYSAHWLGLATLTVISFAYISTHNAPIYPFSRQQFLFGTGYFVLLAVDRLIAGQSPLRFFHVHLAYEIGWLLGFVPFLFAAPLLKDIRERFWLYLYYAQHKRAAELKAYKRQFWRFYGRWWGICASLYLLILVAIGVVIPPASRPIFLWAALGNGLILWSLLHIICIYTVTGWTVFTLALAIGVDLVVGYSLKHEYAYWYSIIGFAVGAFVWLIGTGLEVRRQWKALDYYLYRYPVVKP